MRRHPLERWPTLVALGVIVLLCWAWLVPMARDMYGSMSGPAAWMMTSRWDAAHLLLLLAMWVVMMVGMMLPSAAPTLLLYASVVRKSLPGANAPVLISAFTGGYLLIWMAFSVAATALQRVLSELLLLSSMMEMQNRTWAGALLVVAGTYQFTPLKGSCLQHCRSPAAFISQHWRADASGAVRMGVIHGLYCLGCCWALMLLLFVAGVMNLLWVALIAAFVFVEKLLPAARFTSHFAGGALIVAAAALLLAG